MPENPAQFKAIAEKELSWPVMYGPHRDSVQETEKLIRKLQVGAQTGVNLSPGKPFSWDKAANVVAFNLYQLAQSLRRAPMESWTERDFHPIAACGIGWISAKVDVHSKKYEKASAHVYNAKYEKQLKALEEWGQCGAGKWLPPLSKQTARQWATATKELFRIAYPRDFEQHPKLQELRLQVLGRARTVYGKPGGPGIIRKAMLQAVKQAWSSIAALD